MTALHGSASLLLASIGSIDVIALLTIPPSSLVNIGRELLAEFEFNTFNSAEKAIPLACAINVELRIPIYSGRVFRREAGHRSDLKPATIPK
jgi:hypothetical protein